MLLAAIAAAALQPESPRAFLERIYAHYSRSDYSPFNRPGLVFTPRLAAALAEDARLFKNEVGYVDSDPVCQCQDTSGLHARIEKVSNQGPSRAAAQVLVDFTDSTSRHITFSLMRTAAGWRIADVSSPDEPSFLRGLEASNRTARLRH